MSFSVVGSVAAAGNSPVEITYSFTHRNVLGDSWYRLKMIDIDGKFTYSRVIRLINNPTFTNGCITIDRINGSPFSSELSLSLSSCKAQQVEVSLLAMDGKKVIQLTLSLQRGSGVYLINDLQQLKNAIYILRITTGEGEIKTERVMKR